MCLFNLSCVVDCPALTHHMAILAACQEHRATHRSSLPDWRLTNAVIDEYWLIQSSDNRQSYLFQARHSFACCTLATCRPTSRRARCVNTSRKRCKWLCHATRKPRNDSGKSCGLMIMPASQPALICWHLDISLLISWTNVGHTGVCADRRPTSVMDWQCCQRCNVSPLDS